MKNRCFKSIISSTILMFAVFIFCPALKADEGRQTDPRFQQELAKLVEEVKSQKAKENKEEEKKKEITHKLDIYGRYMPSSDAKSQTGKIELIDAGAKYSYEFKAFGELPIELSLENKYVGIENSTAVSLPSHLIGVTAGLEATFPFFFEKTYMRVGVYPSFFGEDYSFSSSAFRIPSAFLWIRQPNDKLTLIAGVGVFPDFDNEVAPIFGLIYKPNEKWLFDLTPKRPTISYFLNDKVTLFGEGGYTYGEYEVTRGSAKNVVLEYKYGRVGGGIRIKLNEFINSSLSAGYTMGRSLKYRDNIGKVIIEDGLYTEFRLIIQI